MADCMVSVEPHQLTDPINNVYISFFQRLEICQYWHDSFWTEVYHGFDSWSIIRLDDEVMDHLDAGRSAPTRLALVIGIVSEQQIEGVQLVIVVPVIRAAIFGGLTQLVSGQVDIGDLDDSDTPEPTEFHPHVADFRRISMLYWNPNYMHYFSTFPGIGTGRAAVFDHIDDFRAGLSAHWII